MGTQPRPLPRRRPTVEGLERRELLTGNPTVWTVDSTLDGMAGSGNSGTLLFCVTGANEDTNTAGDSIEFDPGTFATVKTLDVADGELELTNTIGLETIDGGALGLTIDGSGFGSVLTVSKGVSAEVFHLTISGGMTSLNGAGVNNDGQLAIVDSTISDNAIVDVPSNQTTGGAGVYNGPDGSLTMASDTVSGNSVSDVYDDGEGGGIDNIGTLSMFDSTVSGNAADQGNGGGVANFGLCALIDDTIADNETYVGGAIDNEAGMTAINCTVADNDSSTYGITGETGQLILKNTIDVENGTALGDEDIYVFYGALDIADSFNNVIGTTYPNSSLPTSLINGENGNIVGVSDAGLGTLADNGGPTETIALDAGSVARNNGDAAFITPELFGDPPTDQRGEPRVVNGAVDSGAYQTQAVTGSPTIWTVDSTADGMTGSGDSGTLLYCVAGANADTNTAGDTIHFDPTTFATVKTLDFADGELDLTNTSGLQSLGGQSLGLTIEGSGTGSVLTVENGVLAQVFNLTISGGASNLDGGGVDNDGELAIVDCTISGNTIIDVNPDREIFGGAGVYNGPDGYLTMVSDTVSSNSSLATENYYAFGGGIENAGHLSMYDSTVSGNHVAVGDGSGVDNRGTMAMIDDTIAGNTVADGDAAVSNNGGMTTINCTIADNSGETQDGLDGLDAEAGSVILINTILVDNTNPSGEDEDLAGDYNEIDVRDSFNNLIGNTTLTLSPQGLDTGVNGNLVGVTDPGLGTLADNGGPTETIALDAGSVAIGAGDVTYITPLLFGDPPTDQRGEPRIVDGSVDIGAYQTQS